MDLILWVYVASALVTGCWTMTIATHEKNRNAFGWFLAGFIYNIFGVIAIYASDKLEDKTDAKVTLTGEHNKEKSPYGN